MNKAVICRVCMQPSLTAVKNKFGDKVLDVCTCYRTQTVPKRNNIVEMGIALFF